MPIGIGYARQSRARSDEPNAEDSLSLDAQESEIRKWGSRNDWTIERIIRDHDLSGGTLDRPGWQEVRSLVMGGGYDGVVTVAISRVARDNLLQEMAWRELQSLKSTIISIREPNLEDDMLRGILGVFGQAERKRIGRFVAASVAERKRRGLHHGAAPFGLRLNGRRGDRNRKLEHDPETYPIAREMAERLLSGQRPHAIWRWVDSLDIPTPLGGKWRDEMIRKWFSRPSIAGAIRIDGELIFGQHPGIVTPDEFAQMQRILAASRYLQDYVRLDSWLRGLVYHGCGKRMTNDTSNHPSGNRYLSFTCQDRSCSVRPRKGSARKVEAAATECLLTDLASLLRPADALKAWSVAHDGSGVARKRATLERERDRIAETHRRAESLYLAGRRDASWLAEQDEQYKARTREIADALAALDIPPDLTRLSGMHALAQSARAAWAELPLGARATIMRQLGTVVMCGDMLSIRYGDDMSPLVPCPTRINWR